jgi:hypothetical protein
VRVCTPCRLRQDLEAERQEAEYAQRDSNPLLGTLAAAGTAAALALAWGGIAYATNHVYAYLAVFMGIAIAWSMNKGMGKVNLYGRALTVVLTLGAVVAGDYVFILLAVSRQLAAPLSTALAATVAREFGRLAYGEGTGFISLLFGVIGAGYILYVNRPPVFKKHFRSLT